MPIGVPGWPEFAFWTASMASVRIVLMHRRSSSDCSSCLWGVASAAWTTTSGRSSCSSMAMRHSLTCSAGGSEPASLVGTAGGFVTAARLPGSLQDVVEALAVGGDERDVGLAVALPVERLDLPPAPPPGQ